MGLRITPDARLAAERRRYETRRRGSADYQLALATAQLAIALAQTGEEPLIRARIGAAPDFVDDPRTLLTEAEQPALEQAAAVVEAIRNAMEATYQPKLVRPHFG